MNKIGVALSLIVGIALIVSHKPLGKFAITMWKKNVEVNPPSEFGYQISFLIIGILFLLWGALNIFGILK